MKLNELSIRNLVALIILWAASLVMSITALSVSSYAVKKHRFSHECTRDGHNYEARYTTRPPTLTGEEIATIFDEFSGGSSSQLELIKEYRTQVYVKDVCTYCGNAVQEKQ
jgi:hypothetical protein